MKPVQRFVEATKELATAAAALGNETRDDYIASWKYALGYAARDPVYHGHEFVSMHGYRFFITKKGCVVDTKPPECDCE